MNTNEYHIERIVKSFKSNPSKWVYAWRPDKSDSQMFDDIYRVYLRLIVKNRIDIRYSDMGMIAKSAIICMKTYEDCGYMLYSDPDELKLLYKLSDERALMLYPACKILKEIG